MMTRLLRWKNYARTEEAPDSAQVQDEVAIRQYHCLDEFRGHKVSAQVRSNALQMTFYHMKVLHRGDFSNEISEETGSTSGMSMQHGRHLGG